MEMRSGKCQIGSRFGIWINFFRRQNYGGCGKMPSLLIFFNPLVRQLNQPA